MTEQINQVYNPSIGEWSDQGNPSAATLCDKYGLCLYRVKNGKFVWSYFKLWKVNGQGHPDFEFLSSHFEVIQLKQQLDKMDKDSQILNQRNDYIH